MDFKDIIGNDNVKIQLTIASEAAKINNDAMPHTLFTGAAGCGKTTMAKALSTYQKVNMIKIAPENIKTSKDVYSIAEKLATEGYTKAGLKIGRIKPTIVFVDEIHRMPVSGQETLGIAMEELYVATRNQYTGENWDIWLPKFTVIGATTLSGKLSKPFRDRFKLLFQFETYSQTESVEIVLKHAALEKIPITQEAAVSIARRGRGIPRTLVNFLQRVWDSALVLKKPLITTTECEAAFKIMGIDTKGLTTNDIKCLKIMYELGIPLGLDTLSIILNESPETISNHIEPYLIQQGLLLRTARGRMVSKQGVNYLREFGYIEQGRKFSSA